MTSLKNVMLRAELIGKRAAALEVSRLLTAHFDEPKTELENALKDWINATFANPMPGEAEISLAEDRER